MIYRNCILSAAACFAASAHASEPPAAEPCITLQQGKQLDAGAIVRTYTMKCPGASATTTTVSYSPAKPLTGSRQAGGYNRNALERTFR